MRRDSAMATRWVTCPGTQHGDATWPGPQSTEGPATEVDELQVVDDPRARSEGAPAKVKESHVCEVPL
jgi:hypothetical protein